MGSSSSAHVRVALAATWSGLSGQMQRLQASVVADTDIETLHDFRVALRKTRALLQLFGPSLPEGIVSLTPEFSWLSAATGPPRDLDVLLQFGSTQLPGMLNVDPSVLAPLLQPLRRERNRAHRNLQQVLTSERYRRLMTRWDRCLNTELPQADVPAGLITPIDGLARIIIIEQCLRLLKMRRRLERDAAPGEFHRMRIRAKRLRYLVDTLQPYLERRSQHKLIDPLTRLQTLLGDHQDAVAARDYLQKILAHSVLASGADQLLGEWLEILQARQAHARVQFADVFQAFAKACGRKL